jgi:predicted RNase H-like nuclease (RuvC/YqgF family)
MKELRKITVQTLPNGYTLDVEGLHPDVYMYHNEMELLIGFITRIGLHESEPLESTQMLRIMFQTIIGQEYSETADSMIQSIKDLEKRYVEVEKNFRELQTEINTAKKASEPQETKHKKYKKKKAEIGSLETNEEAEAKLAEIEKRLKDNPNIK